MSLEFNALGHVIILGERTSGVLVDGIHKTLIILPSGIFRFPRASLNYEMMGIELVYEQN